jgi:hypothetical protein
VINLELPGVDEYAEALQIPYEHAKLFKEPDYDDPADAHDAGGEPPAQPDPEDAPRLPGL